MIKKLLFALLFICIINNVTAQCTGTFNVFTEDFETNGNSVNGGDSRYTSSFDFYDGSNDYWGRFSSSNNSYYLNSTSVGIINTSSPYSGANGDFYYVGEDLDDSGAVVGSSNGLDEKEITFTGINIANATNLCFSGLFAVGNTGPCASSAYDSTDYIRVYYSVDGATEVKALQFSPNSCASTNSTLHYDPNMDGNGVDGAILTNTFSEFTFSIPVTGNSLSLRIEAHMDSSNEEIAFDYFRVQSNTSTLSVNTFSIDETVSIYPNPTSGIVIIESSSSMTISQTSIYDILGKKLKNVTLESNRLDLTNLEDGIYLLKVDLDNGSTITKRIVKQ